MSMNIRLDELHEPERTNAALEHLRSASPPEPPTKPGPLTVMVDTLERIATSLELLGELAGEAIYGRAQDVRAERAREIAEQISVIHTQSDGSWIHGSQENLELAAELIEALLSQDEIQRVEDQTQRR